MERIHVTVRARPLSPEDEKTSPWRISGNSIFIPNHSTKFEFDQIFGEECKTINVYQARTKDIVQAAVRGFNGTVFAYGQTNSGKTHTMRGSGTEPGVIPLAVHDLFQIIQQDVDREFLLRMSYMEIYNEEINDLLVPEHRKLQIHESLERGIYVAGLREEIVASPEQVLDLMQFGESRRHIGETNMNLYSSRSHTIFRMIIESRDRSEDEDSCTSCDAVRVSVLNLVDLAGSERAAKTGAEGVRLKEGSHINKSLMTLGTVIKKLSEGAESQGGHVPYRDSKLTRILQPALGGNANTAIICNITLAQIHADETKSSLQFASRALRVTNCARVNEILTDAALLKRQKKEIEELRAKLQGSHSEHLGEEILNLRNTLLQTELERERIALELEEEKKTQAEWQKRVKEQAKKIENLSSMVLFSSRDETRDRIKKEKRRDTWCPGNLSREIVTEAHSVTHLKSSALKPIRPKRDIGPLVPFKELVNETDTSADQSCEEDDDNRSDTSRNCSLPDPCALLHVTNRRKVPQRRKSLSMEDNELTELQAEYEDLLLKFETQMTVNVIQTDCLTKRLNEADVFGSAICNDYSTIRGNYNGDKSVLHKDSEAILVIKKLQEQIKMLEMDKSSSQQNLDSVVELATEQNICAREKFEELYEEVLRAKEEARVAHEQLNSKEIVRKIDEGNFDFVINVSMEIQELMLELQNSKSVVQNVFSLVEEVSSSFSALFDVFLDIKSLISQNTLQQQQIISNYDKLNSCMRQKVAEVENEKIVLDNQLTAIQKQILELKRDAENSQNSLMALSGEEDLEKAEMLSYIQTLENEISCLTSCSLAKEKEALRKDLEKSKTKLKDTESKLKIAIQEKIKLEGEKAFAEREMKRLHGQNSLLERDISKRDASKHDSFAGRRRESVIDKSSRVSDLKKTKGLAGAYEQSLQEEYRKLEVFAFESETRIASLEDELTSACGEKEEAISINEGLASELESLNEKLNKSNSELYNLQEEISDLRRNLEESNITQQKLESSIKTLVEEKEELAMRLTDSLLEIEEERAIWYAKEKASIQAIEDKSRLYSEEIMSISERMSDVRNELDSCRDECRVLRERLTSSNENPQLDEICRGKSMVNDQLKSDLQTIADCRQTQEISKPSLEMLSSDNDYACEKSSLVKKEIDALRNEKEELLTRLTELGTGSELLNDIQLLKEQLFTVTKERDKLMIQIEEQQNHVIGVEFLQKQCNDELLETKNQVEELSRRTSGMEVKMHDTDVNNSKEKAKLRMQIRGTQAQLDAFRVRYKEAIDESDLMNKKYEEAAGKLKDRLASKGIEVLNLKKQLAAQ